MAIWRLFKSRWENMHTANGVSHVFMCESAVTAMHSEIRKYRICETGGMLIGYRRDEQMVITHITGPGPNARHRLFSFTRDTEFCNRELERLYFQSSGVLTYLGEWHTHPLGELYPSAQDSREMRAIATTPSYQTTCPILLLAKIDKRSDGPVAQCFRYVVNRKISVPEMFICSDVDIN